MVELTAAPSTLQTGDAAVVNRGGTPANVTLKDAATKAVGTAAADVAAGNRGVPPGGTAGQPLVKTSGSDYAVAWGDVSVAGGMPPGGTAGQALIKDTEADYDVSWGGNYIDVADIGTTVQGWKAVLDATTASFTTADETKLDALPAATALISYAAPPAVLSIPLVDATGSVATWTPYAASVLPASSFMATDTADPAQVVGLSAAAHAAMQVGGATIAGSIIGIAANNGPFVQLSPSIGMKELGVCAFDSDESVTVGNGKQGIPIPLSMNGMDVYGVRVSVHTKGITGTTNVQLRRRRNGADVNVLSTVVTLGDEWTVADGVIDAANDDLASGDLLFIDRPAVHSGTAPLGLSVAITARLP